MLYAFCIGASRRHHALFIGVIHSGEGNGSRQQVPGRQSSGERASPSMLKLYDDPRSEEHTSELQSLMRISYAVFCLKKKTIHSTKQSIKSQRHTSNTIYTSQYIKQQTK